jgi:RNA-binding protein 25
LPENQRVMVMDQIAVFRENAARKERAKKQQEEEAELARFNAPSYKKPTNPAEYGYGTRAFSKTTPFQTPQQLQQQRGYNSNDGNQSRTPNQQQSGRSADPQGYSKPVGFVKAQTAEAKVDSGRTDLEEEELRQMRIARDKEQALREVSDQIRLLIDR